MNTPSAAIEPEQAIVEDDAPTALVDGEALSKWPQDLYIPPDALEVFLEKFQGPLDLLLYLIRKQNLDILDIPVAKITEQYMEYVTLMQRFRLDLAAEYLLMAATLAEIKSRMLLPQRNSEEDEEEVDPRLALVQRLQEYEQYSQAALDIENLPQVERDIYLVAADFEDPEPATIEYTATLNDLLKAFQAVLRRNLDKQHFAVGYEALTVREKMTSILERINQDRFVSFEDLFDVNEGKIGLVVSFMAILELVRDHMLVIVQHEQFSPIHIKSVEA